MGAMGKLAQQQLWVTMPGRYIRALRFSLYLLLSEPSESEAILLDVMYILSSHFLQPFPSPDFPLILGVS